MEPLLFDLSELEPAVILDDAKTERPAERPKAVSRPLAARVRPHRFEDFIGQRHILGPEMLLRRAIDSDSFSSIILFGPPGVGKTSLAELIATTTRAAFIRLSGVFSSVGDLRKEIAAAKSREATAARKTIVFIDEIHRFNRAQQDALLPDIESGAIRFIGATTQNPYFSLIGALLSRSLVFRLEALTAEDIMTLITRAATRPEAFPDKRVDVTPEALEFWGQACEGDARRALNAFEIATLTTPPGPDGVIRVDRAIAEASIQRKAVDYGDDGHYDTASAFIKSMRGSDPDAAVYWLAKMLKAGEDIMFIARRVVIFASEDIGNADPRALEVAVAAMEAVSMIGMPEARIILSQAVTYCATAPKSNAACRAIDAAMTDIEENRVQPVPPALRDSHYSGAKKMGHGEGYLYPHQYDGHFVKQDYMTVPKTYYYPADIGYEKKIGERLTYWKSLKNENDGKVTEK